MSSGIYAIENTETGSRYIGSSVNMRVRRNQHMKALRAGKHHSPHLQRSFNKHGETAFDFRPLLKCAPDDLIFYEQRALDAMQPEYNVSPTAGCSRGVKRSQEARDRLSATLRAGRDARYDWNGRKVSLIEIAEETGFPHKTLITRVVGQGRDVEEALSTPVRELAKEYEHDGKRMDVKSWAGELEMHPRRLAYWLADGLTIAECIARLNRTEKAISPREFCKLWGINYRTFKSRFNKAKSIADCLHEPRRKVSV